MSLAPLQSARSLVLTTLRTAPDLTGHVPASRIYPSKVPPSPSWPFIRLDSLTATPVRTDCGPGASVTGAVHCFTRVDSGSPDPEAAASLIGAAIAEALDALADCHVDSAQVIPDAAEADAYHGIVRFTLLTA